MNMLVISMQFFLFLFDFYTSLYSIFFNNIEMIVYWFNIQSIRKLQKQLAENEYIFSRFKIEKCL